MGNTNHPGSIDLSHSTTKGWPILFHRTHSNNVQISTDQRRAKRLETFCNGICFSNRPVAINERVYIRFAEVSTSWSGVLRFGFTSQDPATVNRDTLPRYACPDLTNKPGYWAKALPERFALGGNVLVFYVIRNGDVVFGINGEDKGIFFTGVTTNTPLWALIDIYGNTTAMEFVDGRQLNNLSSLSSNSFVSSVGVINTTDGSSLVSSMLYDTSPNTILGNASQSISLPDMTVTHAPPIPVRHHSHLMLTPLLFHKVVGRNMCLSADRMVAVRRVEEYCNGYVFTCRPLRLGEKVVVQILSIDQAFTGGLTFGMTSCDVNKLLPADMPDDSDLLLDRPEYWIVNKDVCSNPEVGDELSFHLTEEGEIRYGKNGHHVSTLMHVDKMVTLWAFFDVYGNMQKIKILGVVHEPLLTEESELPANGHHAGLGSSNTTPPTAAPRNLSTMSSSKGGTAPLVTRTSPKTVDSTPPPRPPPPRLSPSFANRRTPSPTLPALPPKQARPLSSANSVAFSQTFHPNMGSSTLPSVINVSATSFPSSPFQPAAVTSRKLPMSTALRPKHSSQPPPLPASNPLQRPKSPESQDNANNECSVCFEKPTDCVLYMCGHLCMCYECAKTVKENRGVCPICQQMIKDIIKIYRS